uniref:Uncharacterized protein n=1 Tax=Chromera velia CCMP2878 TaxID=1169474 RepID=A0A0G4HMU5_9ALVE|eukprot:Cvel_7536.t1-p1 / transcript=Cvel_7536.t1 / gene=Cvel_7536 / organism=Chromera_velia_CCMP2878 / gene_product=hypothetical protein / transcript_product=hypothetical protein / location=Cvel_scaffold396:41249-42098(+) / protein_length=214 / sequence_SO=supercontig / SO=protein_coding / is_pseudo=false
MGRKVGPHFCTGKYFRDAYAELIEGAGLDAEEHGMIGIGLLADTTATFIIPVYLFLTSTTRKTIESNEGKMLVGFLPRWKLFSNQDATEKQTAALRKMKMDCLRVILGSISKAEKKHPTPAFKLVIHAQSTGVGERGSSCEWKLHFFFHLYLSDRPFAQFAAGVFEKASALLESPCRFCWVKGSQLNKFGKGTSPWGRFPRKTKKQMQKGLAVL